MSTLKVKVDNEWKEVGSTGSVMSALAEQVSVLDAGKADKDELATVATSGSYNDLSDKPTIPDTSTLVSKRRNGTCYTEVAEIYWGNSSPIVRIGFSDFLTMWAMIRMEILVAQGYNPPAFGTIQLSTHTTGTANFTSSNAHADGFLSSSIKVYSQGKNYILIGGLGTYGSLVVNKMLCNDTVKSYDILDKITIDTITSLPSDATAFTMSYAVRNYVQGAVFN